MGNPDAKNRCEREQPDCRPRGVGGDCWTPKQLAKYGIDPAEVAPEPCVRRVYAEFLYQWNDCMSGCYTTKYGTQPIDEAEQRALENKKKKKKKNDKDSDGDGTPDSQDSDRDGDGIPNDNDAKPDGEEDQEQDKEQEDFPDTDPNDGSETLRRRPKRGDVKKYNATTTSWRVVTLCRNICAERVRIDYTPCFCDRVKCGPDDDELGGDWDRETFDDPPEDGDRPDVPEDDNKPSQNKNKLNVTDSRWGAPIEIVYGRHVVAGNIVWIAPTRREKIASVRSLFFGASSTANGGTAILSPVIDFAVGLCAGVQGAITRIYFNDYLFYDANTRFARVGTFNNGAKDVNSNGQELITDLLYFYDGDEAQKFPREITMADEFPIGYRDLSLLVFKGLDLRKIGNKFPSIRIELAQEVAETPVMATATPSINPLSVRAIAQNKMLIDEGNPGGYKVLNTDGDVLFTVSGQSFDAQTVTPISDTYVATQRGTTVESRLLRSGTLLSTYSSPISDLATYGPKGFSARGRNVGGTTTNYFVMYEAPHAHFHSVLFGVGLTGVRKSIEIGNGVYGGAFVTYYDYAKLAATESVVYVKYDGQLKLVEIVMASTDGGRGFTFNPQRPPVETVIRGAEALTAFVPTGFARDASIGALIMLGRIGPRFAAMAFNMSDKTLLWAKEFTFSAQLTPVWHIGVGELYGAMTIADGSQTYVLATANGDIIAQSSVTTTAPYTLMGGGGGTLFGVGASSFAAVIAQGIAAQPANVSDIVYDIGVRALLNPANMYVDGTRQVIGYKISSDSPAKTFLDELATVTGVAIFDDGNRLVTTDFTGTALDIPHDDIGYMNDKRFEQKVRDEDLRPSAQAVQYFDNGNGLATTTVVVKPDLEPDAKTGDAATFSTNVVLTGNDAYALAEALAATIPLSDITGAMALGPKYMNLTPTDLITSESSVFDRASYSLRNVVLGADKSLMLTLKQHTPPITPTLPDVEPVVDPPVTSNDEAGIPIIIQAKPVTFEDTQPDESFATFYAGVLGDIGETTLNMFIDGAYVARQTVTKPLAAGVVTADSVITRDVFGPQWENNDALTIVFDGPPDTSIWLNATDINDITSRDMTANLLLVGREWIQFKRFDVAIDGVTVTFYDLFRGLRGTDAYQTDAMIGRVVYAYDPLAWGKFTITKSSAMLGPVTVVARSLTNEDATPIGNQALISMEPSYHWPIRQLRIVRDMTIDWITVTWNKRSRFNGPLDDQYFFEVPGLTTGCEIFVIKDDFDADLFKTAVASIYSDVFEWNATSYVRMYQIISDDRFVMTVPGLTSVGIDYLNDKFHIVVRTVNNTMNPDPAGHYLIATYDPSINADHVTGVMKEPAAYTVATLT